MNQAVRSLSISLESIELSTPAISSEEIATIQDANFNVPVIIDTYSLKLIETEASEVPRGLRHRLTGSTYTWAVYQTSSDPLPDIGLKGDIWIRTLKKPRVYFKSARNSWERWERCPSLGVAPNRPTLLSQLAVYHPWLRRRRLEFDGTKLEWGLPETPPPSYLERLDRQVTAHGWPKYSELSLDEVAARLSTGPPSPGRIVVGATSLDPHHDLESRTPPPPPPVMQEAPSNRTVVIQPDGFTLARKSFPPPGAVVPTTGFKLFSAFAADAAQAHAKTKPSSNAFWGSQGSFPPPVIADAATKVIVKVEEEEEERAVLELIKRSRDETSSPPPIEPPLKRVKIEDDTSDSALAIVSTAEASSSSGGSGPASIFYSPALTYERFLASLPSPLTHQEQTLEELGVTSLAYLESFATAPPLLLGEMTAELQEHGFTFMEALILRNGLASFRPPRHVFGEQPRLPESVEAFLDALEPSMAHHAPMFQELGIETTHLPILARFDAASYAEFEETLRVKGLSWADRFLIKVALRTRLPL